MLISSLLPHRRFRFNDLILPDVVVNHNLLLINNKEDISNYTETKSRNRIEVYGILLYLKVNTSPIPFSNFLLELFQFFF